MAVALNQRGNPPVEGHNPRKGFGEFSPQLPALVRAAKAFGLRLDGKVAAGVAAFAVLMLASVNFMAAQSARPGTRRIGRKAVQPQRTQRGMPQPKEQQKR